MSCKYVDMYKNFKEDKSVYVCKIKGVVEWKDCKNCSHLNERDNLKGSCSYCGRDNCGC